MGLDLSKINSRTEAEAYLRTKIEEESTVQFILKNLSREKDGSYNWKMNLPVIVKHYREILGHKETDEQYEGPTLFVKGEQSSYILTEEFPDYLHNFPNAKLSVVPNAGHWVHAENPEEFSRQVFDFLRN
jgi:esterase